MSFENLKKFLLALDLEEAEEEYSTTEVEVLADSLQEALEIGAHELGVPLGEIDYEILQKGSSGYFGLGRTPYRVLVRVSQGEDKKYLDIPDLDVSLETTAQSRAASEAGEVNQDAKILIRIYRTGVFLRITPHTGKGKPATMEQVLDKIRRAGVTKYNNAAIEKELKNPSGTFVKIGEYVPKPEADSTLAIEISPDEMKAYVTITAPRPGGRHLQTQDVINALKAAGVVVGFKEEEITKALEEDRYGQPIVAAEGKPPKDGRDAYIDYKVRIEKKVEFKEDEHGRVDFLQRDLVENVVQGQVLAELVPAERGQQGYTIFNKIIPARDGKSIELKPGKGTILSEDGKKLIAERNGQVVFLQGRLNVEEVYVVTGDVGLDTGNIMFLGSIVVRGSVTDNMQVKAAGTIEIGGNVQKAQVEAEGDIIIRSGVQGRDGAFIQSTAGSVYAKFIQNARVDVEKDVIVQEGILHSRVQAGERIICNGRRAQIVGGEILAGKEVRVKQLGATSSQPTKVVVGVNPKILTQLKQLEDIIKDSQEKLEKLEQNIRTLTLQKSVQKENFPAEKEENLIRMQAMQDKLKERIQEAQEQIEQLREYMAALSSQGAVHVEKTVYPGVTIEINGATFHVKDEYHKVTFIEEKGNIRIVPYQESEEVLKDWRKRRLKRL
ncbi:MAG: FapA family protein [Leptospiraceae bacterium]|nr:FapA family protein [Leptospiraceae bacterium]MDW8307123.1 FapA family protein [Leptospiraceae bacterium]